MSKKKNDEEKEVKTEAENQEESKTDAEDNKAEAKEKENDMYIENVMALRKVEPARLEAFESYGGIFKLPQAQRKRKK